MFPINKNNIVIKRTRDQIKLQVKRLKALSKTHEQIVKFLEDEIDKELGLYNFFDSAYEMADFLEIPVSKLRNYWMA